MHTIKLLHAVGYYIESVIFSTGPEKCNAGDTVEPCNVHPSGVHRSVGLDPGDLSTDRCSGPL